MTTISAGSAAGGAGAAQAAQASRGGGAGPLAPLMLRYRALPRSGRWLVMLVLFLGAYFLVIEPVLTRQATLSAEATRTEAMLKAKADARTRVAESERVVTESAKYFGMPALPVATVDASAKFEARINQIFAANKVSPRTTYRDPQVMNGEAPRVLTSGASSARRLERLVVELTFETDVITFVNILKDLEHAPEIACVSKVVLRKQQSQSKKPGDAGPLQVTLSAEAWALGSAGAGGNR